MSSTDKCITICKQTYNCLDLKSIMGSLRFNVFKNYLEIRQWNLARLNIIKLLSDVIEIIIHCYFQSILVIMMQSLNKKQSLLCFHLKFLFQNKQISWLTTRSVCFHFWKMLSKVIIYSCGLLLHFLIKSFCFIC